MLTLVVWVQALIEGRAMRSIRVEFVPLLPLDRMGMELTQVIILMGSLLVSVMGFL